MKVLLRSVCLLFSVLLFGQVHAGIDPISCFSGLLYTNTKTSPTQAQHNNAPVKQVNQVGHVAPKNIGQIKAGPMLAPLKQDTFVRSTPEVKNDGANTNNKRLNITSFLNSVRVGLRVNAKSAPATWDAPFKGRIVAKTDSKGESIIDIHDGKQSVTIHGEVHELDGVDGPYLLVIPHPKDGEMSMKAVKDTDSQKFHIQLKGPGKILNLEGDAKAKVDWKGTKTAYVGEPAKVGIADKDIFKGPALVMPGKLTNTNEDVIVIRKTPPPPVPTQTKVVIQKNVPLFGK